LRRPRYGEPQRTNVYVSGESSLGSGEDGAVHSSLIGVLADRDRREGRALVGVSPPASHRISFKISGGKVTDVPRSKGSDSGLDAAVINVARSEPSHYSKTGTKYIHPHPPGSFFVSAVREVSDVAAQRTLHPELGGFLVVMVKVGGNGTKRPFMHLWAQWHLVHRPRIFSNLGRTPGHGCQTTERASASIEYHLATDRQSPGHRIFHPRAGLSATSQAKAPENGHPTT